MSIGKIFVDEKFSGTCWLISSDHAVTAAHCVGDVETKVTVKFWDGEKGQYWPDITATVIVSESQFDGALLKLEETPKGLTPFEICDKKSSGLIAWRAPGFPCSLEDKHHEYTLTGTVGEMFSAFEINGKQTAAIQLTCENLPEPQSREEKMEDLIGGVSGSPVILPDQENRVVGIIRKVIPPFDRSTIFASPMQSLWPHFQSYLTQVTLHPWNNPTLSRPENKDIEKLKKNSQGIVDSLCSFSTIRLGPSKELLLKRGFTSELKQFSHEGSFVITGEPGAGKTRTLVDLFYELLNDGQDVVFFEINRISKDIISETRNSLNLENELDEVLFNWPRKNGRVIILDGLDAARSEFAQLSIKNFIQKIISGKSGWRVIASIRKFDLRYGKELQKLFPGNPHKDFFDKEFPSIHHFNVPKLSEEEFSQIENSFPELFSLIKRCTHSLRGLLEIPFNLCLLAELLEGGIPKEALSNIQTQLELLEKYWDYRVKNPFEIGLAREALLKGICQRMVEKRSVRVNRLEGLNPVDSKILKDLLSQQVLIEWSNVSGRKEDYGFLAFSHNILFDFAVEILILRSAPKGLVEFFAVEPDLVLAIRPSFSLHFHHMWKFDKENFWELVFSISKDKRLPEIGKIIGPAIAADNFCNTGDLSFPIQKLNQPCLQDQEDGEAIFRHIFGAVLAFDFSKKPIVGVESAPWCELLEEISNNRRPSLLFLCNAIIMELCNRPDALTPKQKCSLGKASRRLLEVARNQAPRNQALVANFIQAVCRTFDSDIARSSELLRFHISQENLKKFGYSELYWLAGELDRLIDLSCPFVAEVYQAGFSYYEPSEEETSIGSSRIMNFISTQKQDYEMGQFLLGESFSKFLDKDPKSATCVLIQSLNEYILKFHHPQIDVCAESFFFRGDNFRIKFDSSFVWDYGNTYEHDDPIKMLNVFEELIERWATKNDSVKINLVFEGFLSEPPLAVIWRRILKIGAKLPDSFGREIKDLAWAIPVLKGIDTKYLAGEFLKSIFPILDGKEQEKVEKAVLSIPSTFTPENINIGNKYCAELLGCLPKDFLKTSEAKKKIKELTEKRQILPNKPDFNFSKWEAEAFGEDEYLAEIGVPTQEKPNQKLLELGKPVAEFSKKHLNSVPDVKEIRQIFPCLKALNDKLITFREDGVHEKQEEYSFGIIAESCSRIARVSDESFFQSDELKFVREILLKGGRHYSPIPDASSDERFNDSPSWGKPAPRIDAAEGLMNLSRIEVLANSDVYSMVKELSSDQSAPVRFQIAQHLFSLSRTKPDLMWDLFDFFAEKEKNLGVIQGLLSVSLEPFYLLDKNRTLKHCISILSRISGERGELVVKQICLNFMTSLFVWRDEQQCKETIWESIKNPKEAGYVLQFLREALSYGSIGSPNEAHDGIRRRAIELVSEAISVALEKIKLLEEKNSANSQIPWSKEDQEVAQDFMKLVDSIAMNIYFASGAYYEKKASPEKAEKILSSSVKKRFFSEMSAVFDNLASIQHPKIAHRILETLEAYIEVEPKQVLQKIGKIIQFASLGGYQYESLGVNLMVQLIERYLADYRPLLQMDEECRNLLINVLNTFVQVGWPKARKLAFRLEEIYR